MPLFYISPLLFFCLVLSLFLSYPFLLLAYSPDFSPPKPHCPIGRLFCVALVFFVLFERLEDTYLSWWYVQHMLPYAFMHLYSIFNLRLFVSILSYNLFNLALKRLTETVSEWYQHLLNLFAIFYKSNTEGTSFQIMFVCFTFM